MDEVMNVGETILLDGEPLSLVTRAGVEAWIKSGVRHNKVPAALMKSADASSPSV